MRELVLLGFVANHHRNIRPGSEYDKYFPKAAGDEKRLTNDGTVADTVKAMDKIVHDTLEDTAKIAPLLVGKELPDTCQNIWNFIYNHIQYKNDRDGVEELRRPRRSWAERSTGVDCDCMSLFAGSILANLGIDFKFRITKYTAGWQHVYVIVPLPTDSSKFYVIDCVLDRFNYEKPYSGKFDHKMTANLSGIPISMLGYVGANAAELSEDMNEVLYGTHFVNETSIESAFSEDALDRMDGLGDTEGNSLSKPILDSILAHITATRDYIRKNPESVIMTGGAKNNLQMLDYAIAAWNTPNREKALDALEKEEARWSNATKPIEGVDDTGIDAPNELELEGFEGYEELLGDLGKLKGKGKAFFSNVKKAVKAADNFGKKVATKVIGAKAVAKIEKTKEKVQDAVKKVGEKAKEVAKKALAVVKKFIVMSNPLSLAARAGFLLAMKTNMFQWAQRLYPGLISQSEAANHGISTEAWNKSKDALDRVAGVFSKIGGKRSKLEKFIREGRAKKRYTRGFTGFDGLGGGGITEAVTVVAAATALLTAASKMRQAGVSKKDYEQLQKNSGAKKPVQGMGEDSSRSLPNTDAPTTDTGVDNEVPETEQFDTAPDGSIDESKKGISKFIAAIKKWFQRNKHADVPGAGAEIIKEEQETQSDPAEAKAQAELEIKAQEQATAAEAEATAAGKSPAEIQEAKDEAYNSVIKQGAGSDAGIFDKISQFAKENPKTTAAVAILTAFGITMCFPAPRKALFGSSKKPQKSLSGLSGTAKSKTKKTSKQTKKLIAAKATIGKAKKMHLK